MCARFFCPQVIPIKPWFRSIVDPSTVLPARPVDTLVISDNLYFLQLPVGPHVPANNGVGVRRSLLAHETTINPKGQRGSVARRGKAVTFSNRFQNSIT